MTGDQPKTVAGLLTRRLQIASTIAFAAVAVIATTWDISQLNIAVLAASAFAVIGTVGAGTDRLTIGDFQGRLNKPRHASFKVLQGVAGALVMGGSFSTALHEAANGRYVRAAAFGALGVGSIFFCRYRVKKVWKTVDALRQELDEKEIDQEMVA